MKTSCGDWNAVLQLAEDNEEYIEYKCHAHRAIGKQFERKYDFVSAACHYELAGDLHNQITCLFRAKRYSEISSILENLNKDDHEDVIKMIGHKFRDLGSAMNAS